MKRALLHEFEFPSLLPPMFQVPSPAVAALVFVPVEVVMEPSSKLVAIIQYSSVDSSWLPRIQYGTPKVSGSAPKVAIPALLISSCVPAAVSWRFVPPPVPVLFQNTSCSAALAAGTMTNPKVYLVEVVGLLLQLTRAVVLFPKLQPAPGFA